MSTSGDVESTSNSLPNSLPGSAAGSPRSKVKFLCSHGGKILPRPADGYLKYVGGETRVVSVPRNITFTDLMKKLNSILEGHDVTLKYQLISEELDALVSVKSDEDLRHMFEEYDRQNLMGTPRLRTFLFPASPIVMDNPIGPMDRHSLEQRYINSVNGIIFNPLPIYNTSSNNNYNNNTFKASAGNTSQTSFSISSACSSPKTPPEATVGTIVSTVASGSMTRARSSPNLCNLGVTPQPNQQYPYYHHRQPPPPPPPHHLHHMHHHPKPPLDPSPHKNSSPDHHMRMRSPGLADHYYSHNQHTPNPYTRSSRSGGHMGYQRASPYDDYYGNNRYDRESPPGSPLARSPLQNNYGSKWDSVGGR